MSRLIHNCPECGDEIFGEMTKCSACYVRSWDREETLRAIGTYSPDTIAALFWIGHHMELKVRPFHADKITERLRQKMNDEFERPPALPESEPDEPEDKPASGRT